MENQDRANVETYLVAIHAGRATWEQNFGDEVEMVKEVYDYLQQV